MAKKDLSLDEFRPDPDLDFDFSNEINTGMDQTSKSKSRQTVDSVARGLKEGAISTLTKPGIYDKILSAALPKHYGDITSGIGEVTGGLYELYDQTQKEVKPRLNRLTRGLDRLVPEEAKVVKKILGKITDLTGGRESDYSPQSDTAAEDQAVGMMMGEIFKAQQSDNKIRESRQIMRDAIEAKRYSKSADLSSRMQRDISIIQQYTTNVTQAYQKKSLELQLRSYLGQRAYFTKSLELLEVMKRQNEAIIHNTSLPDAVKITESERLKTIAKERMINSLYGDGSALKKGIDRLKRSASEYVQGFTMRMDMAEMGLDMANMGAEQIKEFNKTLIEMGMPPMTKAQFAGALASDFAINQAADWASPKLKALVEKNPSVKFKLAQAAQFALNPVGKIESFRKGEGWKKNLEDKGWQGKLSRFADFVMDHFKEDAQGISTNTGYSDDELKAGKGFDQRAYTSLTAVIPGYLSMIQREVASLRAGKDTPYLRYDFGAGRFKSDERIRLELNKQLADTAKRSGYTHSLDKAAEVIGADRQSASEEQRDTLRQFLSKLSKESGIEYNRKGIEGSEAYRQLSSSDQDIVDGFIERLESDNGEKEVTIAEFSREMAKVRQTTPSMHTDINRMIEAGYGDLLAKSGIVRRKDGSYDVDGDSLHDLVERYTIRSDVNVKEDIKETTPEGLLKSLGKKAYDGMKNTKLFNWRYKKGVGDRTLRSGPMAQDVQANLGDEAAPGGKQIDIQTMNGSFFAAIQYLGDKVENLFKGKKEDEDPKRKGKDPLKNIDKNVARIAAMIAAGNGFTGTGGSGSYREGFSLDYFLDKGIDAGKSATGYVGRKFDRANDKISELWTANKDKLKDKAVWLFEKSSDLAGSIFDSTKNFIKSTAPEWFGKVKDFTKRVGSAISEQFQTVKDIYLPDGAEPVIRAAKLKAGEYYDELTGKVITSIEQLSEVKGNVVDKAGNIVVSSKELANGLYDHYGEKIKSISGKMAGVAIGGIKWAAGKIANAAIQLKDMAVGGSSKIKEWWDNSPEFKFPEFGTSFYGKKHLAELINIRDILLGETRNVRKRIKKEAAGSGGGGSATGGNDTATGGSLSETIKAEAADLTARYTAPGSFLGNIADKAKSLTGLAALQLGQQTGPMTQEQMKVADALENKKAEIKERLGKASSFFRDKFGRKQDEELIGPRPEFTGPLTRRDVEANHAAEFIGPMQAPSGKLKGKIANLKDRFNASPRAAKLKGMLSSGKDKLLGLTSTAGNLIRGDGTSVQDINIDGAGGKTDQQKEADAHSEAEANGPKVVRRKRGSVALKDRIIGDNDGDGVKDGSVEDQREKQETLKAQRDKGMLGADTSTRYKSNENVIDTIANKASGLISSLSSGLGTVFNLASMLFSGGSAIAKGIFGGVTGLGKIATTVGAATGGPGAGAAAAGRAALLGIRGYGAAVALSTTAAGSAIAGLGSLALSATAAVAGTVVSALLSPAVLIPTAIAATAYGLYKLYQYANRNNASDMERLRLNQYGFGYNTAVDRYNHYAYMLEAYLQDGRIGYESNGKPYILHKKVDIKEVLSLFDIDEKDKEAAERFTTWFTDRFKPVFMAHLAALYSVDKKKKLADVNDLEPSQKLDYLRIARFENGPYSEDVSPIKELQLTIDGGKIKESYDNLILKVKQEVDKSAKKHKGVAKPSETKPGEGVIPTPGSGGDKVDGLKTLEANQKANQDKVGEDSLGEGDGATSKSSGSDSRVNTGAMNMAKGPLSDGSNGMQFVKLRDGSRLDGLSPAMLKQFLGMAEEYGRLTGKTIGVNSGSRTFEQQAELYKKYPGKAAKPGRSLHEYGLAVDIDQSVADELDKLGLMKKYGFTRPVGGEPWHIEPALIQKSLDLAKSNANERESMVELSAGRGGGGYGSVNGSTMGKRNHELAMSLLNQSSKLVDNKVEESKVAIKETVVTSAVNDDARSTVNTVNTAIASVDSKAKQIPNADATKKAIASQTMLSPDAERSQSKTTAEGGASKGTVDEALVNAAMRTGVSVDLLRSFAAIESSMDPNAKSRSSSAAGLMQFLPDTWKELIQKHGSKYGLSANASPFDPNAAALMGGEFIKANMKSLSRVRPNPSTVDLYISHLLGATGARRFFEADPSQLADMVLGDQARANASLFFANGRSLTIAEAYERIKKRVQDKATAFGIKANVNGPGLKAPKQGEPSSGIKTPTTGGVEPNLSGPEAKEVSVPKRGFSFDNTTAGYVAQPTQSGQRNDPPVNLKLESLMEKSNDTAVESLEQLKAIAASLSEERLAKVLAAVMAVAQKAEKPEETIKAKDKENMNRTATARGSSLDLARRTAA